MTIADGQAVKEDSVARKVRDVLTELKSSDVPSGFSAEDDFMRILDLDSFDAVRLTARMHEVFGIEFGAEPDDVDALTRFGSLVELVRSRAVKGV